MAFPTIAAPIRITKQAEDNVIKSNVESGYVHARPRSTRDVFNFDVQYKLSEAHLALLLAHDATVKTYAIFAWTNTEDDTTYNVRQTQRLRYDRSPDEKGYYNASFGLQSV